MGKTITLREAVELIWQTVKISDEQGMDKEFPYLFVVGAGISAPEILPASGIIEHCQQKVKQLYEHDTEKIEQIYEEIRGVEKNSEKYYSFWFEKAYQNKIHRQQYLKNIISSTSETGMATELEEKICPNCGNKMVVRRSRFGKLFYGCSTYPACNGIINI